MTRKSLAATAPPNLANHLACTHLHLELLIKRLALAPTQENKSRSLRRLILWIRTMGRSTATQRPYSPFQTHIMPAHIIPYPTSSYRRISTRRGLGLLSAHGASIYHRIARPWRASISVVHLLTLGTPRHVHNNKRTGVKTTFFPSRFFVFCSLYMPLKDGLYIYGTSWEPQS